MKKIKMMLTVMAVFAVVAGALAFKAKDFNKQNLKCGTDGLTCPILTNFYTATTVNPTADIFCTTALGNTTICPIRVTDQEL